MKIIKYIATLLGLILLFNISLYLVSLIPSELLVDNVKESVSQIAKEGEFYEICTKYITLDNYMDLLILNESISFDNTDPVNSYLKIRKNYNKNITKYEVKDKNYDLLTYGDNKIGKDNIPIPDITYSTLTELSNFLDNKVTISANYARYYHGYLTYLRPILILFNIGEIRWITFVIFFVLLIVLAYEIYKKIGLKYMFATCFSLLLLEYLYIPFSIDFTPTFLIMMIFSILMMCFIEKINWNNMKYLCFIVGAITCFFDYLTVPTLTLAIPLLLYVLYYTKNNRKDGKELFIDIFISSVLWSVAYSITWLSKWIIYDIFMEDSLIQMVIEQLKYRSLSKPHMFLECFYTILIHFALVSMIFIITTFFIREKTNKSQFILYNKCCVLFVGCIPLLFDIVTFNHYINHSYFTYRDLIPFFIVLWLLYFDYLSNKKRIR